MEKHKYRGIKQHTQTNNGFKKEITRKNRKYLETNENKNTTYQDLRDEVKAVLRGNLYLNSYIKQENLKSTIQLYT